MGNCCRSFQKSTPIIKNHRRRQVSSAVTPDEGLGHSFCYNKNFISISGASVSANTSTALSTSLDFETLNSYSIPAAFESSNRFSSIPLQPIPRFLSGPIDRGFLSGPIERGFLSGPIENGSDIFSSPLDRNSISKNGLQLKSRISKAIAKAVGGVKLQKDLTFVENSSSSGFISIDGVTNNSKDENLQWAQGKAGEDRVHVVISEDKNWVFVGIYDGFNGPDATDYLLSNFYLELQKELENLDFGDSKQLLKALSNALMKTEETFLDCADMMVSENPELALMGSCVLVMLMSGEDLYLMNVGDSRAVLASKGSEHVDDELVNLNALQLTLDHSTNVEEEVVRIRNEHQDDSMAVVNDRVKGSLKVTRAFGAGFLKQPKWNNALLEMFQIDYIGTSPYITCNPSLYHHKIGAEDKFLILSSDGLYQYFTNEEAVAEVELFISTTPEGDPAQHLLEELLFRAAKTAEHGYEIILEYAGNNARMLILHALAIIFYFGLLFGQISIFASGMLTVEILKKEFDMNIDPKIARPILEKKFPRVGKSKRIGNNALDQHNLVIWFIKQIMKNYYSISSSVMDLGNY